ncbi:unnamed protein product [Thelazia callipaeda]|uniref:RecQ-mediated genome instability protein 1 n=1 Tax=Thelazia callipaeda TaxID=103827 RepID=A0A0N5D016_THECL|nr:unnamed protein product [Thelazia callipaeda]
MDIDFIRNFFREKLNVILQEEWLNEVVIYLRSLEFEHSLLSAVYEQWLYTDLAVSSRALLPLSVSKHTKRTSLKSTILLQINSIIDIGTSIYSQYRLLTREIEDNSGFQIKPDENQAECDPFRNSNRMLLMEVSDGNSSIKAIEYSSIPDLSLLTTPGCKILVKKDVCCRRGILLLTEFNCIVLGGDDELLMKTGRPIEMMTKRLNIAIPNQGNSLQMTTNRTKEKDHSCLYDFISRMQNLTGIENTKPVMQVKPLSEELLLSKTLEQKQVFTGVAARIKQSVNNIKQLQSTSSENLNLITKTPIVSPASKRSNFTPSLTASCKKLKIEGPEDSDDVILIETPKPIVHEGKKCDSKGFEYSIPPTLTKNTTVIACNNLGIESISQVLQSMRFAVVPKRKLLAAAMETNPLQPLHINEDGLWALTVALSDKSYQCLACVASHKFLVELIGWTPEEALAARASKDPSRRKDGTLRIKSAGQSMRRLDLIWEVEFFPNDGLTPIIHRIDTYAEKFGLIY